MELLIGLILLFPGLTTATLGLGWLSGLTLSERLVARLTGICYSLVASLVVILSGWMISQDHHSVRLTAGSWFEVDEYRSPLLLQVDLLSLPLVALSVILVGVIGAFSQRYMHREGGYLRFFFLLNLFGFGVLLLFLAGSFDLMIAGWELVGLTSVLLIGFFQQRNDPVRSALRVFLIYRVCDIGLLTGVAMLHHYVGAATVDRVFTHPWPDGASLLTGGQATVVGLLFLLAAMGKSAQVPFSGWLPRAMEGPTPSSAIFYGALSVHAGAYLLLRVQPLIESSPIVSVAIVTIGILTAIQRCLATRALGLDPVDPLPASRRALPGNLCPPSGTSGEKSDPLERAGWSPHSRCRNGSRNSERERMRTLPGIGLILLSAAVLSDGNGVRAQSAPPREDHQFWSELQLTKHVSKKQDVVIFGVVRIGRNWQRPVDERFGVGYAFKVNPHLTIMPTYLRVEYQPYPGRIIHEERLILNATLKGNLGNFVFTDRNLYERRVRPNTGDFNIYRNRLQIDHPAHIGDFRFKPFVADELWHSDQRQMNGQHYGWFRNRISTGIIKQFNERLSGEFYVLMQHDGLSRPGNIPVTGAIFRYTL